MAATYLEVLQKIQDQALDNLKKLEAVQLSTLTTVREILAELPSLTTVPSLPTIEGVPTFKQIVELNSSFATQLLDQEKNFANQLTDLFTPAVK